MDETISVLTLADDAYVEEGALQRGQQARSVLLDGFVVAVSEVFDAS